MASERRACGKIIRAVAGDYVVASRLDLYLANDVDAGRRVVGDCGVSQPRDCRRRNTDSRRIVRDDATDNVQLSARAVSKDTELAVARGDAVVQRRLDVAA